MNTAGFVGTKDLVRLFLRRDRVTLPVWIVFLAISLLGTVSSYMTMFKTVDEQRKAVDLIASTPSIMAMSGPVFGSSLGSLVAYKMAIMMALVALMSLLTVIRHTRGEEEVGRFDLLGSNIVGRYAPLTASLVVTVGANLVISLLFILIMVGYGLPMAGSIAYALSWSATGCLFAALAGVAAQLTEGAGAARGIAGGILGLAYIMRAAGDVGGVGGSSEWLSWLSPLGLAQRIRPFAGERWWLFAIFISASILLAYMAYVLCARRDIGSGILPQRTGRAAASPGLRSPMALAWRLHSSALTSWTIGLAAFGLAIASMAKSTQKINDASPKLREVLTRMSGQGALMDMLFVMMISMFGLAVTIYAIQAVLRLHNEEETLRTDPILVTPVSRLQLATSHLLFAYLGPAVIMVITGLVMGIAYGSFTGHVGREVSRLVAAHLVQLPAIWVIVSLTLALLGLSPKLIALSWAALVAFLMMGQLGDLLEIPKAVMNLSPWTHVPKLPGGEFTMAPLIWLLTIAVVLTIAGLAGFRRRDLR